MLKDNHDHGTHKDATIETLATPPIKILPAPLTKRLAAGLIDSAIVTGVWLLILVLQQLNPSRFSVTNEGALVVIAFVYYFFLEGFFASTPGKSLFHLRVVDNEGDECSFTSSLLRNVLRFVDWLPFLYLLGLVFILASKNRRRLGDFIARTIVTTAAEKDINPPPAPFLFH